MESDKEKFYTTFNTYLRLIALISWLLLSCLRKQFLIRDTVIPSKSDKTDYKMMAQPLNKPKQKIIGEMLLDKESWPSELHVVCVLPHRVTVKFPSRKENTSFSGFILPRMTCVLGNIARTY